MNKKTEKHTSKLIKSSHNGWHFFLDHHIVLLQLWQLMGKVSKWSAFLYNTNTQLKIRCIITYIEPLIMVRIGSEGICCHWGIYFMEWCLHVRSPRHWSMLFQAWVVSQEFENVSTTWPNIPVIIDTSDEHALFRGILGAIHMEDGIYVFLPGLLIPWSKPITQPVSFFDGPFTFKWVNRKTVITEAR